MIVAMLVLKVFAPSDLTERTTRNPTASDLGTAGKGAKNAAYKEEKGTHRETPEQFCRYLRTSGRRPRQTNDRLPLIA